MRLTGRTMLIIGGGTGIGLALARAALARGVTVVITGRTAATLEAARASLPGLRVMVGDTTREEELRSILSRIQAELGGLDILVNCAAVLHEYDFLGAADNFAQVADTLTTNILGTIQSVKLALPLLLQRPEAAIVMMSSAVALTPMTSVPVYSATKAAVRSLTHSLRAQLAGGRVHVIEALPPMVDTPMSSTVDVRKISPSIVAQAILSGIERDAEEVPIGPVGALGIATRLSPALGARLLARATRPLHAGAHPRGAAHGAITTGSPPRQSSGSVSM